MRVAGDRVGPRGLAVVAIVAIAGIALGTHGWSTRHAGATPGSLTAGSSTTSPTPAATATATAQSPGASPAASSSAGPLLSSQSYASQAFLVWPGTPSAAAKAAETGLTISVQRSGQGIAVTAGVTGQPAQSPKSYPTGAKVYVVETSMGDDSGSDYNLGDDGLVVTDSSGRLVQ